MWLVERLVIHNALHTPNSCYFEYMPWLECRVCSNRLYIRPNKQKIGWGKYCSKNCQNLSQIKSKEFACKECGKSVFRRPAEITKSKTGHFFCNRSCSMSWKNRELKSGANHYLWAGGKATYRERFLRKSDKIRCNRCGINDVRVLDAHHKDSDRNNNVVENLEWLCKNCHYLEHHHK